MNNKIYKINEIKDILYPIFDNRKIKKAILFGSYVKGKATSTSDIDIVVDGGDNLINFAFYGLLEEISEKLKKDIDLIELSEIDGGSPMMDIIHKEGVVLYEKER